ncbi:MAG: nucleoside triphosphate pyrophosphohydrolase [Ignavibacteria bacterium]|nr:nucleoside triphosphate pyrophosphohydrolase [Ignavibacteria bacterium]
MNNDIILAEKFIEFVNIVRRLRKECPWDREQTHESLRRCLLEESYEVLEAIDNNDMSELKKELGDLMLQVVFHGVLGEEADTFDLTGVLEKETEKLIHRHPHIFGDVKVSGSEEVKTNWEKLKKKEGRISVLDGVPVEMPALFRAYRVQEKAAKVGFDWKDHKPVYEKILEEVGELRENMENNEPQHKLEDEFGDVLFSIVNYARFMKINPEDALRKTIEKFIYRFRKIEDFAREKNIEMESMTLEEMDAVWNKAKNKKD